MKQLHVFLVIFLAYCAYACLDSKPFIDDQDTLEVELRQTIDKFNQAFQEGSVEVLESLITQDYLHTNGSSKSIRKETWLNYLRKREKEIEEGVLKVISYGMDEVEIELYGKAAIVSGRVRVENKRNEEIREQQYRVTHLWIKKSDGWKRAAFHDGKIQ